jgi:hypothetical protein
MSCCNDQTDTSPVALEPPRRNNFYYGKMMDVLHFQMEQRYGIARHALSNRLTLGDGVLCGLGVTVVDGKLCVAPGVAVDVFGREIVVAAPVCIDPWAPPDPCEEHPSLARNVAHVVTLCLAYRECLTEYGPVLVPDCDTKSRSAAGTTVESYLLRVVEGEPPAVESHLSQELCHTLFAAEAADRRRLLCEGLEGDCAPGSNPCVTLARVELTVQGTIGAIQTCAVRPRVYSNAVLLDLILCLAEKLDECCGGTPTPHPEPETSPLKVVRLGLMSVSQKEGVQLIAALHPGMPNVVNNRTVNAIDVVFSAPVAFKTVTTPSDFDQDPKSFTFIVTGHLTEAGVNLPVRTIPGKIVGIDPRHVRFLLPEEIGEFGRGDYELLLVAGDAKEPGIRGREGQLLDGEPIALPSGNDKPGGDFKLKFKIDF